MAEKTVLKASWIVLASGVAKEAVCSSGGIIVTGEGAEERIVAAGRRRYTGKRAEEGVVAAGGVRCSGDRAEESIVAADGSQVASPKAKKGVGCSSSVRLSCKRAEEGVVLASGVRLSARRAEEGIVNAVVVCAGVDSRKQVSRPRCAQNPTGSEIILRCRTDNGWGKRAACHTIAADVEIGWCLLIDAVLYVVGAARRHARNRNCPGNDAAIDALDLATGHATDARYR